MDSALLHGREINIGEAYWNSILNGLDVERIREELDGKYRAFSRKRSILCLCCGNPVKMVIGEERRFHFRHYDLKECSYSENFKKYEQQKGNFVEPARHQAGRAILKTILTGKLKPHGIQIEEGYRFRKVLSFIPDYVFTLPTGKKFAIDYITGFRENKGYATHLAKRLASYKELNFTPFCFVDSKWFAYEPNVTPFTTLEPSEKNLLVKTEQDHLWDKLLDGLDSPLLKEFVQDERMVFPFDTRRIVYMDVKNRKLKLMKILYNHGRTTYVVDQPITVDLENALTWKSDQTAFYFEHLDEEEERIMFTVKLSEVVKERDEKEAAEHRKKEEEAAVDRMRWEETVEKRKIGATNASTPNARHTIDKNGSWNEFSEEAAVRVSAEVDWDLARRMRYLDSPAFKRKGQKSIESARLHMAKAFGVEQELSGAEAEVKPKSKTIVEKNREERIQKILNRHVTGEGYLGNTPLQWKKLVFSKFNAFQRNELDLVGMLQYLKDKGVPFHQKDSHVEATVKEFVKIIAKEAGVKAGGE